VFSTVFQPTKVGLIQVSVPAYLVTGYIIPLNRPVRLYSTISLGTCDLEYPVTFSIYRRITPFSSLLSR